MLIHAALSGNPEVVAWVLTHGGDPSHRNTRGQTTMHAAVQAHDPDANLIETHRGLILPPQDPVAVVALLAEAGADVNALDKADMSPLYVALISQSAAVAELQRRGAIWVIGHVAEERRKMGLVDD